MQDKRIDIRVSEETLNKIDSLASKLEFDRSQMVKLLIKYGLERIENGDAPQ